LGHVPGGTGVAARLGAYLADRRGDGRWEQVAGALNNVTALFSLSRGLFSARDLPGLMGRELFHELASSNWVGVATGGSSLGPLPRDPRVAVSSLESRLYLRNQLLRDSDWASMAHSVELRTPLVDRFLLKRLSPYLTRMKDFPGKSLLANSPSPPLAEHVANRPKTGFNVPTSQWMSELSNGEVTTPRDWCRWVGRRYAELV